MIKAKTSICIGKVKWFEVRGNYIDSKTPLAQIAGWPECGPTWYCLKELWLDEDGNEEWRDIEIKEE